MRWDNATTRAANAARRRFGYRLPAVLRPAVRLLPPTIDTDLIPGLWVRLDLRDHEQAAAYGAGPRYGGETAITVRKWVVRAERFFDIGAGFGYFSYLALAVDPRLIVHAFEPDAAYHEAHAHVAGTSDVKARFDPERVDLAGFQLDEWLARWEIELPRPQAWVAKVSGGDNVALLEGMTGALSRRAFRAVMVTTTPATSRPVDELFRRHRYHRDVTVEAGADWVYLPEYR